MAASRISAIEQRSDDTGDVLSFLLDGRPRFVRHDASVVILRAGWVRLGGFSEDELAARPRAVPICSEGQVVTLHLAACWCDDPEVIALVRGWLEDRGRRRVPYGPYGPRKVTD